MRIPRDASPHEVAILEKLLLGWSQKQVGNYLHYKSRNSVSKVYRDYVYLFVTQGGHEDEDKRRE